MRIEGYEHMDSSPINPRVLVAIDPGVKNLAWAQFEGGALSLCGLSQKDHPTAHARAVKRLCGLCPDVLVLEQMTPRDIPNAADLIAVSHTGAYVAGALRPVVLLYPTAQEWKGSVPKRIHHPRLAAKLTPAERAVVAEAAVRVPASLLHNVWDAVGLGLWGLGRR